MNKEDVKIGTCLYTVPRYKDQSPQISKITHLDAGIFEHAFSGRMFNATRDYFKRDFFLQDVPTHVDDESYDAIIDKEYIRQMYRATRLFHLNFCKAVSPIEDWSYMHYGYIPHSQAEWKGEVNVGDTFMGFGMSDRMAVYKITSMEYSDPHGELHAMRGVLYEHEAKELEWPMEGIYVGERESDLQDCIYRHKLIHPISPEIFDKALEACMAYRNTFDKLVADIREQYGLPEFKKERP